MNAVQTRVARGVEILDRKYGPDWRAKIDPSTLNMADTCNCVLGQLYCGSGVHMDGFDAGLSKLRIRNAGKYGFDTAYDVDKDGYERNLYSWGDLRDAWIEELSK